MKNASKIPTLNDENFDLQVLTNSKPVLVMFSAEWSGSCHIVLPILKELAEKFSGVIKFFVADIERSPENAKKFNVKDIPTFIIFKNGKIFEQMVGIVSKRDLEENLGILLQSHTIEG